MVPLAAESTVVRERVNRVVTKHTAKLIRKLIHKLSLTGFSTLSRGS